MDNCIVCKSKNLEIYLEVQKLVYWKCNFCEAKFLDKENYIIYSCTKYRDKNSEHGILWNDKSLKINFLIDLSLSEVISA